MSCNVILSCLFLLNLNNVIGAQKSIPQPSSSSTPATDFTCPEDFGYFPHPSDCSQYYVCVFGGALLESCTGGLMYSHDLQTCDWPRNVYCYNGTTFVDNNNVQAQAQQQPSPQESTRSSSRTRGGGGSSTQTQQQQRSNSYAYNPIKIETYGQLSRAAEESSVIGKKPGRVVLPDDEYQQQRSGRSYEGSLPNYKEEIYQQGRNDLYENATITNSMSGRFKRSAATRTSHLHNHHHNSQHAHDHNNHRRRHVRTLIFDMITTNRHHHNRGRTPRSRNLHLTSSSATKNSLTRMDITNPHHLQKYKINGMAGLKSKAILTNPSNLISHRVSSPGSVLFPPSYYQTPTYGFVNIGSGGAVPRLRPTHQQHHQQQQQISITTPHPSTSSRVVKISSKPYDNERDSTYFSSQRFRGAGGSNHEYDPYRGVPQTTSNAQHHHHVPQHHLVIHDRGNWNNHHHPEHAAGVEEVDEEEEKTLSQYVTNAYVNRLKGVLGGGGSGGLGFATGSTLPPPLSSIPQGNSHISPQSNQFPKKIVISTGSLGGSSSSSGSNTGVIGGTTFLNNRGNGVVQAHGSVSSSPTTRGKYAGNTNKYYDNTASILQQQQQQQDYGTDDAYVNQRYAANVGNNTSAYYYTPGSASEDDDSSYYVYDDEEDDGTSAGGTTGTAPAAGPQKYTPQQADFVDYNKYQQPQTQYRTPSPVVTRRPSVSNVTPTSSRTSSRGSSRTRGSSSSSSGSGSSSSSSSSSGSGSSTRSRPTLKPKSSIVKQNSQPVRDVYLDAPSRPDNVYETPSVNSPATKCKKDLCVLPDCSCGGKDIPGGLRAEETPQIVLLTFDDSVNDLNKNLYRDLFEKGRKNPNGCPISATFYISHEWTDYSQVQNLAADGHEIASHSVSHSFGEQYSQKKWDREINGQREILAAYGGVKLNDVRGMRAPFLAIGGNNMFKMLYDSNFTYDSSMPIYENRPPSWPYTLDYRVFHDCMIPPCPTKSYPGVWEVPMVMWQDLKGGRCSMGDACSNPPTAEGVYQMLAKNFERHYTTNRAPFGLYYHAAWFTQPHHKEGFEAFLDTLVQMDDVWLVTNWQALQWIRSPTPNSRVLNFQPWSCHDLKDRPPRCNHPKVCNLWHKSGVRYMKTCQHCPQQYPWTGNTGVPFSNSL